MSQTLELTKELMSKPSITPDDARCQDLIAKRLEAMGFKVERLRFGDVDNLWARRGDAEPVFTFAGHTDVVPYGSLDDWTSHPFEPEIREGLLYGRGACDMKSCLAAMIVACENFIKVHADHQGSITFLLTSDEEGPSVDGTRKVIEHLNARNEKIDWVVVGEPTSRDTFGDMIKIGRRGSLSGKLKIKGKQGHIAYPHLADNPIHRAFDALSEITKHVWDKGNKDFQPTSFQFSNIHSGSGVNNVIPGDLDAMFNFRFSPESTQESLKEKIHAILDKHQLNYDIQWTPGSNSFYSKQGRLLEMVEKSIHDVTGITTETSTSGGISDARFFVPTGAEVVELGVCGTTAHQVDEYVSIDDLEKLTEIYQTLLTKLLVAH